MKRTISKAKEQDICDLAEAVAEEYTTESSDKANLELIAEQNDITYSYGHYGESFDGMLEHKSSRFHIYCNLDRLKKSNSPRSRFTFAHELGHYYIDDHRNALESGKVPAHPSICEYQSKNIVEQEADLFASNLLMPASRFSSLVDSTPIGAESIFKAANQFKVSLSSAAVRYCKSDIVPCTIIKWSQRGYDWKLISLSTYKATLRKTIEKIGDIPRDSPTFRILNEERPKEGFFEAGTTVAHWFPYIDHSSQKKSILIEQAISLGSYGAITILFPESGQYSS
ncbi:MAG: ImmA/IrrE family metallo-endopeptidase [Calditrichia bacterium]